MKEWIKNLTGEEIARIYKNKNLREKPTEEINQKILKMIAEYKRERNEKKGSRLVRKFLLAAITAMILLIPGLFLINNVLDRSNLFLAEMENNVLFTINDKTVQLKSGDRLLKGTYIQTNSDSNCKIHYAEKAIVKVYGKTELKISENKKNRISFALETGKIYITEYIDKNTRIAFFTHNAYIYALGTMYSVEYNNMTNETTIKTHEGIVRVETIPGKEEILVQAGEEIIISDDRIINKETNYQLDTTKNAIWKMTTRYFNPNSKERIIGFEIFEDYIIAVTEHSILCFTGDYNEWEYNVKETVISPPAIFQGKVYIPAKNVILCFNLYTGARETNIKLIESMLPGQKIVHYNNKMYVQLLSGIYLFDNSKKLLDTKPFIFIFDAATPVFYNNHIYITSYISRKAEAYDLNGTLLWSVPLNDDSSCTPVIIDNYLYIGTKNYTLYKITLNGEIEKQSLIEGTIESLIPGYNETLFINTERNRLYKINTRTLNSERFYDNITSVLYDNNVLVLGKEDNRIKLINNYMEKEIILRDSYVTSLIYHDTGFYAGLNNGYIMRIQKE